MIMEATHPPAWPDVPNIINSHFCKNIQKIGLDSEVRQFSKTEIVADCPHNSGERVTANIHAEEELTCGVDTRGGVLDYTRAMFQEVRSVHTWYREPAPFPAVPMDRNSSP